MLRIDTKNSAPCRDCVGGWASAYGDGSGWPLAEATGHGNHFLAWYHRRGAVFRPDQRFPGSTDYALEDPVFPGWHTNTYTFLRLGLDNSLHAL